MRLRPPTCADMIRLDGSQLVVTIEPEVGGEVRSVVDRDSGAEVLFRTPWELDREVDRWASPDDWVRGWVGGWQLLFPNAGVEAVVAGERHPFHGAASTTPWEIVGTAPDEVVLRWRGAGLEGRRAYRLAGSVVRAFTEVRAVGASATPFMATEHLILGGDLLEGDPRIVLPGGRVWPMSDDGEPLGPRAAARPWPDGYDRPARPGSRFAAVVDLGQRWAAVEGARGLRTTVRWSHSYPGLWLWAENGGAASPPWDGRARCLGVEPATGDRADGLAAAIARGEAVSLAPGEVWRAWVELEVGRVPIP